MSCCPHIPLGLCPELQDQGYHLLPPFSYLPISHLPNPLTSPDTSNMKTVRNQFAPGCSAPPAYGSQSDQWPAAPRGAPLYGFMVQAYSVSLQQCYPQELCKSSLFLHGPELPFPQLNEAWICSSKGFASVFYGPCCGMVLTQKSNSFFSPSPPFSLCVYL